MKALAAFYREAASADGHRSVCKDCEREYRRMYYAARREKEIAKVQAWRAANREAFLAYQARYNLRSSRKSRDRESHLRRKFGITQADYDRMLAEQGGGCAICGRPPGKVSLHVDHDHETGRVRGLLCVSCNNALGQLQESHDLLAGAMHYLDREDEEAEQARARARELVTS